MLVAVQHGVGGRGHLVGIAAQPREEAPGPGGLAGTQLAPQQPGSPRRGQPGQGLAQGLGGRLVGQETAQARKQLRQQTRPSPGAAGPRPADGPPRRRGTRPPRPRPPPAWADPGRRNPATMPASRSPLPPVARPGCPVGLIQRSSRAATGDDALGPLRTRTPGCPRPPGGPGPGARP